MTSEERYKNGKIYTIRYRGDDSLIYVGSTCLPLYKRWYQHKSFIFNEKSNKYNYYIYQKIRETNDFENWYIELYEEFPCENKEQLLKREGEIIREIGTLNKKIENRSGKEWRMDNKEHVAQKGKLYYEQNIEKLKTYRKDYYEENKDILIEKQKEYQENHNEMRKEISKRYYDKNKEKIHEKIICECGCVTSKQHMKRHQQSKKHLDLINLNSNENDGNL